MKVDAARDEALGALYAADARAMDVIDTTDLSDGSFAMAEGVWANKEAIDAVIAAASTRWRIERMPVVDRNILRLGTYELLFTGVPVGVTISACVDLAKEYSTSNSGSFINGVLSAVAGKRDTTG